MSIRSYFKAKVGAEVLFRIHQLQHARAPKEKNIISLPNALRRGNDREVLEGLVSNIVSNFRDGYSVVLINVGNKVIREGIEAISGRKPFGTHAINFLSSEPILKKLSKRVGENIRAFEGIKPFDKKEICFYELGSEYTISKDDTCYIALKAEPG